MHKTLLHKKLPLADAQQARELYRALEKHYQQAVCSQCAFYKQYGVMIVKGDLEKHLQDMSGDWHAVTELPKLEKAKLVELDKISARQHRITFVHIQAERTKEVQLV